MKGPSWNCTKKFWINFRICILLPAVASVHWMIFISLEESGCRGAIVGKAIYEGLITLKDLANVN